MRSTLSGADSVGLDVPGLQQPHSVAFDAALGNVYWTDSASGKVQRARDDGSGGMVIEDVAVGLDHPAGIAVGPTAASDGSATVVWAVRGQGKIQRADVPSSAITAAPFVEDVATPGRSDDVFGVVVGPDGVVYWTLSASGKIQRSTSGGHEDIITSGLAQPEDITLDVTAGKLYWSDPGSSKIQRASTGGADLEDLVISSPEPRGVALDVDGSFIFWGDSSTQSIRRMDLDGECSINKFLGSDMAAFIVFACAAGIGVIGCFVAAACLARRPKPSLAWNSEASSDPMTDGVDGAKQCALAKQEDAVVVEPVVEPAVDPAIAKADSQEEAPSTRINNVFAEISPGGVVASSAGTPSELRPDPPNEPELDAARKDKGTCCLFCSS